MAQGASVAAPSKIPARCLHMRVRHSVPTPCMDYAAALKPPDLVVMDEAVQAYGTFVNVTVADDRWRCR
eukprot:840752-Pyramimonas_sp.AAC.1